MHTSVTLRITWLLSDYYSQLNLISEHLSAFYITDRVSLSLRRYVACGGHAVRWHCPRAHPRLLSSLQVLQKKKHNKKNNSYQWVFLFVELNLDFIICIAHKTRKSTRTSTTFASWCAAPGSSARWPARHRVTYRALRPACRSTRRCNWAPDRRVGGRPLIPRRTLRVCRCARTSRRCFSAACARTMCTTCWQRTRTRTTGASRSRLRQPPSSCFYSSCQTRCITTMQRCGRLSTNTSPTIGYK